MALQSEPSLSLVRLSDVTLNVASSGPQDGPLTLLLHGFPEFWFGWRNQIDALAGIGLHVVAPDQRGYNLSSKLEGIAAYQIDRVAEVSSRLPTATVRAHSTWWGMTGVALSDGG